MFHTDAGPSLRYLGVRPAKRNENTYVSRKSFTTDHLHLDITVHRILQPNNYKKKYSKIGLFKAQVLNQWYGTRLRQKYLFFKYFTLRICDPFCDSLCT